MQLFLIMTKEILIMVNYAIRDVIVDTDFKY